MFTKLILWYLNKMKYSIVLNMNISPNEIKPKMKHCIMQNSNIGIAMTNKTVYPKDNLKDIIDNENNKKTFEIKKAIYKIGE